MAILNFRVNHISLTYRGNKEEKQNRNFHTPYKEWNSVFKQAKKDGVLIIKPVDEYSLGHLIGNYYGQMESVIRDDLGAGAGMFSDESWYGWEFYHEEGANMLVFIHTNGIGGPQWDKPIPQYIKDLVK